MRLATCSLAALLASSGMTAVALAQSLPPPPTHAQGVAADQRQGSTFTAYGSTVFFQTSGSGTPLILIHGYPLSGALFQYQQAALASHFQVITLDLPGFGQSSAPVIDGSAIYYARVVQALMDHLGVQRAIIGGHSMGGIITQEIYRESPSRFIGMVLIDTTAQAASFVEKGEWPGYANQATQQGVSSIIPIVTPQLLTGSTRISNQALTLGLEDIIAEGSTSGATAGAQTLTNRFDYSAQLRVIAVPALVIEGREDPVYGLEIAQALQQQIPRATLALIPGASHVSIYEQPALANQAILSWANSQGF